MENLELLIEKIKEGVETKETLYKEIRDFLLKEERKYISYAKNGALDFGELPSLIWLGVENAISTYEKGRDCKFLTWASHCIKFLILSEYKKQKTREFSYDFSSGYDEDGLSLSETIADPDAFAKFERLEISIDGEKALSALKTLSPTEQKIVTLCCIKNIPLAKCARGMGITESKARTLKLSALRKLKQMLS